MEELNNENINLESNEINNNNLEINEQTEEINLMTTNEFLSANNIQMQTVPVLIADSFHIDIVLSNMSIDDFIQFAKSKNTGIIVQVTNVFTKYGCLYNGKIFGIIKPNKDVDSIKATKI